jgi:hypothetical protein
VTPRRSRADYATGHGRRPPAAGQGRAFDVALKLQRNLEDHWSLAGGYRLLDGGAEKDELYTFARFNYAVLSLQYRW